MTEPNLPRLPSTESTVGGTEVVGISTEDKVDQLIAIAAAVRRTLNIRSVLITVALVVGLVMITISLRQTGKVERIGKRLDSTATANKANGDLLVNCVTPGTNPAPKSASDTGNECWDRLHSTSGTDSAIAAIVDNIYCDHRRALADLPIVPDPSRPCRSQTPADVLR